LFDENRRELDEKFLHGASFSTRAFHVKTVGKTMPVIYVCFDSLLQQKHFFVSHNMEKIFI
jgi:hypothetical protein